jgi:hypothetical protein
MVVDGLLTGSKILVRFAGPIHFECRSNDTPTEGEEAITPVLGDADTTCKVFILQILRDNVGCDLWYL